MTLDINHKDVELFESEFTPNGYLTSRLLIHKKGTQFGCGIKVYTCIFRKKTVYNHLLIYTLYIVFFH